MRRTRRLAVESLEDRRCPSTGYLLVSSFDTNSVLRYREDNGAFVDAFVPHNSGGLSSPNGILFGPGGHNLYVSSGQFGGPGQLKAVLSYDGATGGSPSLFTDGGDLGSPRGIIFGRDGDLYVADFVSSKSGPSGGRVAHYDASGHFLGDFVAIGSGGLGRSQGLVFGPDGNLYVTNERDNSVLRYDGTTGAFIDAFVKSSDNGGLDLPGGLTFGPDGTLYVASVGLSNGQGRVLHFQGPSGTNPGASLGAFVPPGRGNLLNPLGLIFGPDGNLYVTSEALTASGPVAKPHTSSVKLYGGADGHYIRDFVRVDNNGGLDGPSYLTFTETDPTTLAYTGSTTAPSGAASPGTTADFATTSNFASASLALAPVPDPDDSANAWLLEPTAHSRQRVHHPGTS